MTPPQVPVLAAALLLPLALFSSCSKKPEASQPVQPPLTQPLIQQVPNSADTSTPKAASLAFANALVAGDIAEMGRMVEGTNTRMFAYYSGFAGVVASERIFATALKARFGDDTAIPPEIEYLGNLPSMPSNYDDLTEQIDGDRAVLVDPGGHPGVRLRKVGGTWKVDLITADSVLSADAIATLDKSRDQLVAIKKGFDQSTAKILDGTYTDPKSALAGVKAAIGQK